MDVAAIYQLNDLLHQADAIEQLLKGVLIKDSTVEMRQSLYDTYIRWYETGYMLFPNDIRPDFEQAYTVSRGGMPSIREIMELLNGNEDRASAQKLWSHLRMFEYPFDEQIQAVLVARRRLFTRSSKIPYGVQYALATICKKVYQRFSIEDLFIDNGCARSWWIHPLKPVDSIRMKLVFGWLDGIVLYAPEQELPIVIAVCEDILRKPRLPDTARTELQEICIGLSNLAVGSKSSDVPEQHTNTTMLVHTHRQRLVILEQQAATFGVHTPPHIVTEINDIRATIEQLQLRASNTPLSIEPAYIKLRQEAQTAYYLKHWTAAVELLVEVVRSDPADTHLQDLLREARHQHRLEGDYQAICALRNAGHIEAAMNAWDDFDRRAPEYPDPEGLREWVTRQES